MAQNFANRNNYGDSNGVELSNFSAPPSQVPIDTNDTFVVDDDMAVYSFNKGYSESFFSRNKRNILIVSVVIAVCCLLTAGAVVLTLFLTDSLGLGAKSDGSGRSSTAVTPEGIPLPPNAPAGELHTITVPSCNCTVARSYDGNNWEPTPRNDRDAVIINCFDSMGCYILNVTGYTNHTLVVPAALTTVSTDAAASRLLWQGTFGASLSSIQDVSGRYADDAAAWVMDQMIAPRTSVRGYFRKRTNSFMWNDVNPYAVEQTSHCDVGSRFSRSVFSIRDQKKYLIVDTTTNPGFFTLFVEERPSPPAPPVRVTRAVLSEFMGQSPPGTGVVGTYLIRCVNEGIGAPGVNRYTGNAVRLETEATTWSTCGNSYTDIDTNPLVFHNPPLEFSATNDLPGAVREVTTSASIDMTPVQTPKQGEFVVTSRVGSCTTTEDALGNSFLRLDNVWYRHTKRAKFVYNTPASPSQVDSGTTECPIAPFNYQNEFGCRIRPSCGGSATVFDAADFFLNDTSTRWWYEDLSSRRYVYTVRGLRLEGPYATPVCSGSRSRWLNTGPAGSCTETPGVGAATRNTIAATLAAGGTDKSNPLLRDIVLIAGPSCDENDLDTIGASVASDGFCWQNIHPDEYSVRDATDWNDAHDGNAAAAANGNPNPIAAFAVAGGSTLFYPASHMMARWEARASVMPVLGRQGDEIAFSSLPFQLQTIAFALRVGALSAPPVGGAMACGSLDEVENIPSLGNHYPIGTRFNEYPGDETAQRATETVMRIRSATENLLTNVMHKAPDQLRQRVAWTLSNILVMSTATLTGFQERMEGFAHYYDGFTANAFGSFFDVLKHVSFNRFMGSYLTFIGSRSHATSGNFPDENYAREIMQLFSIGLVELNDDGTPIVDPSTGIPYPTYTQDDIVDYARVWTGFESASWRTNSVDERGSNAFDPMRINVRYRDVMPKNKLGRDKGYLGDNYPLCNTLPPRSWLMEGARYRFVGDSSGEGSSVDSNTQWGQLEPASDGSSPLYNALCARSGPGAPCSFPGAVTLPTSIPCTSPQECDADTVTSVKIVDPYNGAVYYYRHRSVPCVRLTLFDEGQIVRRSSREICANPEHAAGVPTCCDPEVSLTSPRSGIADLCIHGNEWVKYNTAVSRCAAAGYVPCEPLNNAGSFSWTCATAVPMWSQTTCKVQAQVYDSGRVGVVDVAAPTSEPEVNPTSDNFFRVHWNGEPATPNAARQCVAGCTPTNTTDGLSCLCDISVSETPVFSSVAGLTNYTANEIANMAHVGSANPALYPEGTFVMCTDPVCTDFANATGVTVWLAGDDTSSSLSTGSVFALPPFRAGGRPRYVRNLVSTVYLGDEGLHSFRNPPAFNPFVGWGDIGASSASNINLREQHAYDEVDALLEHLNEHEATAPFIAWRFAQHMVTSNPSPRYMKRMVNAFRTGVVNFEDGTELAFSRKNGDLGALVYVLLTDREARNPILMADPSFGMVNDPLISVHRILRGLDYVAHSGKELQMVTINRIGVGPMQAPTVFNFYLPENQPPGELLRRGLFSPAAQLTTAPIMIDLFNGVHSLIDYGLTNCYSGFGNGYRLSGCSNGRAEQYADGNLTYFDQAQWRHAATPAADIVDELGLILTGGRVLRGMDTHNILTAEFERVEAESGRNAAFKTVAKALVTSPEFNTGSVDTLLPTPREFAPEAESLGRPMKSVIYLFLNGGLDSHHALAPHTCDPLVRISYENVRTIAGLSLAEALQINPNNPGQPCSVFGMHPALPQLHQLYQDGDALWVANIGALVEPTTMQQYSDRSVDLPVSLYAHNQQQLHARTQQADNVFASGVMARIGQVLTERVEQPYKSVLQSVSGATRALGGTPLRYDIVSSGSTMTKLTNRATLQTALDSLLSLRSASPFADYFGDNLQSAINFTESLTDELAAVTLLNPNWGIDSGGTYNQIRRIAELMISANSKNVERGLYYATTGGFDTHNSVDLDGILERYDTPIGLLADELKAQNLWDDTIIVIASEFARTMKSNGLGTDHAWGGNAMVVGGGLNGNRVLGTYISAFEDDAPDVISNGRVLPTTPWESIWLGISEWMGVTPDQIDYVLPNAKNFPTQLFNQAEMFN